MNVGLVIDAVRGVNLNGLRLAARNRQLAREYWSHALRHYDELMGRGLECRDPVEYIFSAGWASRSPDDRVTMPAALNTVGGTRLDELLVLGAVTSILKPARIFEIGTFMGRTTSVFVLNAPDGAEVITLDLPPAQSIANRPDDDHIDTDLVLMEQRRVGSALSGLGLEGRYRQLFANSLEFDPAPYAGSIELGFIDGAHSRRYVESDTHTMAAMAAPRGLVFWHDYGGKGRFRELTGYLDDLSRKIPIYRVTNTTLAWTPTSELKALMRTSSP
jgi:hypothetical protein